MSSSLSSLKCFCSQTSRAGYLFIYFNVKQFALRQLLYDWTLWIPSKPLFNPIKVKVPLNLFLKLVIQG